MFPEHSGSRRSSWSRNVSWRLAES